MGILYYFIGCVPVCVLGFALYIFIDKIHLVEKIQEFDNSNSGPIYDFLKTIFLIIVFFFAIASLGAMILPIYIFFAFSDGNIIQGLLLTLLCSIAIIFDSIVFDK